MSEAYFVVIPSRGIIECRGSEKFVEKAWKDGVEMLDSASNGSLKRKLRRDIVQIIQNMITKNRK